MELLQLFDDDIKMLDEYVERKGKRELPDDRYFMVVLIFIQNDEGKFLIQKTSKRKKNVFAFTGGHVTYGDTDFKTAIKETQEEMGITLEKDKLTKVDTLKYPGEYCTLFYYKGNYDLDKLTLQEEEVEDVFWFTDEEIDNLIKEGKFREANIPGLEVVRNWLENNNICKE